MAAVQPLCRVWRALLAGQAAECQQLLGCQWMLGNQLRGYAVMPSREHQAYQVPQRSPQQQPPAAEPQPQQPTQPQSVPKQGSVAVEKIYKGKWVIPVRFLVRAKVFQLLGCGSIGVLLGTMTLQEATWLDIFALTGLAVGMVGASCSLWYYSRRYVGEMSLLLPGKQHVRFSVLDFWGNREDNDIHLSQLQPPFKGVGPKEMSQLAEQLLFPVNVPGDRQYYLSIHAGQILNPKVFFSILKGEYDPSKTADSAAATKDTISSQ